MGFWDDVGDGIAGTFTFGQCNGDGCGGDHRGHGINPIGNIVNKLDGVKTPADKAREAQLKKQQQANQPIDFTNMFGPNNSQLTGLIKPGLIVIGGIIVIELVLKLI